MTDMQTLSAARSIPSPVFQWFADDWTVTGCAPGNASVAQDIADVFMRRHGSAVSSAVVYVHPAGSDGSYGSSWRHAFRTLTHALRETACGTILLWPGEYTLSDFRYTDIHGTHAKRIIAPFGDVVVRVAGDRARDLDWTLDGDYGGQYSACIATPGVRPIRVLRDDVRTPDGDPLPMPLAASRAALGVTNFGWSWDPNAAISLVVTTDGTNRIRCPSTQNLAVGMRVTGAGIPDGARVTAVATNSTFWIDGTTTAAASNVPVVATGSLLCVKDAMSADMQANRANFELVYGTDGGDNRVLLLSTVTYWENVTLLGYFSALAVPGQPAPEVWAKRCRLLYSATHALLVEGGAAYTQDCEAAFGSCDGANYNSVPDAPARGVEINYRTRWMGDVWTYGGGASQPLHPISPDQNKNGSSNHNGCVVRVGGSHTGSYGPNIGDTSSSCSWNLGTVAGLSALDAGTWPAVARVGFLNQANSAWLDGCVASGQDVGVLSDLGATVYVSDCRGTEVTTNGGVIRSLVAL